MPVLRFTLRLPLGPLAAAWGWFSGVYLGQMVQNYAVTIPILLASSVALGWGAQRWTKVPGAWICALIAGVSGGCTLQASHVAASYTKNQVVLTNQWRGSLASVRYLRIGAGLHRQYEIKKETVVRAKHKSTTSRYTCKATYVGKLADGRPVWVLDEYDTQTKGAPFDHHILEPVPSFKDAFFACQATLLDRKTDDRVAPNEVLLRVASREIFIADSTGKGALSSLQAILVAWGFLWLFGQLWWLRHEV